MKYLKTFEMFSPLPIWIATGMLDAASNPHSNRYKDEDEDEDEDDEDNEDKPCRKCEIGYYRKTQMTKSSGELECDNCGDTIGRYEK